MKERKVEDEEIGEALAAEQQQQQTLQHSLPHPPIQIPPTVLVRTYYKIDIIHVEPIPFVIFNSVLS